MSRSGNSRRSNARERGGPALFAIGMAVALAGFVLIWVPWKGLTIAGAGVSLGGTVLLSVAAWRQAARRWTPARPAAADAMKW